MVLRSLLPGKRIRAMIRTFVIRANRLFREGLCAYLDQQQDVTVLGVSSDAEGFLRAVSNPAPDCVIVDLRLPGREGLADTRQIRSIVNDAKVLLLGVPELESDIMACIEAGASGYLPPDASLDLLLENLRAIVAGDALCSPAVAARLIARLTQTSGDSQQAQKPAVPHLTSRERQILALLEQGLANKEIAGQLAIELQTVKNHVHNILAKLELSDRRQLARRAREWGLVAEPRPSGLDVT